jgi:hypothetical protein
MPMLDTSYKKTGPISGDGRHFSLHHDVQTNCGVHSASQPVGTGDSIPQSNGPGRGDDNSPLSTAEVKNEWDYSSTFPYIFWSGV